MVLTEHIAVMDLMALADALLLPDDDLALASALKSPLFGFDDDDLFAIACGRRGSLREALRAHTGAHPRFAEAEAMLARLAGCARREPFAFLARVLGPEGGRKRILGRLGHEAADALDELLNLALDYEKREAPTLQGFVAWLRAARTDVKRDMEITRDEVRVMTVHGAKGLEAPLVIIADAIMPPAGPPQRQPRLLALPGTSVTAPAISRFVWAGPKITDTAVVSEARERIRREAEHEYRRLLYVAMTRAIDRLVVCGAEGERGRPAGCWYDLVRGELAQSLVEETGDDGESKVWRYRKMPPLGGQTRAVDETVTGATEAAPAWIAQRASIEPQLHAALSPSRLSEQGVAAAGLDLSANLTRSSGAAERRKAQARGELMHRLLQSLPDIPIAGRAEAARRYLGRAAIGFAVDETEDMIARVMAVLDDVRFAPLFSAGSRAELPIAGRVARTGAAPLMISGQVDRLVVTPEAVLIADYKTNRPAPRRIEDVPDAYLRQLALYRAVLMRLYPDRPVRAALIWTDVPDLMEISEANLDAALAGVTTA
jgi:ATP-dependent helicase/nuclease subunit A